MPGKPSFVLVGYVVCVHEGTVTGMRQEGSRLRRCMPRFRKQLTSVNNWQYNYSIEMWKIEQQSYTTNPAFI